MHARPRIRHSPSGDRGGFSRPHTSCLHIRRIRLSHSHTNTMYDVEVSSVYTRAVYCAEPLNGSAVRPLPLSRLSPHNHVSCFHASRHIPTVPEPHTGAPEPASHCPKAASALVIACSVCICSAPLPHAPINAPACIHPRWRRQHPRHNRRFPRYTPLPSAAFRCLPLPHRRASLSPPASRDPHPLTPQGGRRGMPRGRR